MAKKSRFRKAIKRIGRGAAKIGRFVAPAALGLVASPVVAAGGGALLGGGLSMVGAKNKRKALKRGLLSGAAIGGGTSLFASIFRGGSAPNAPAGSTSTAPTAASEVVAKQAATKSPFANFFSKLAGGIGDKTGGTVAGQQGAGGAGGDVDSRDSLGEQFSNFVGPQQDAGEPAPTNEGFGGMGTLLLVGAAVLALFLLK